MDTASTRRLANGRTVVIRPIAPGDHARERAFVAALSSESRYLRFHKWVSAPSEKLVHFLTDIDQDQHMAFVCTVSHGGDDEIVGEGRYVVEPGGLRCEFGIVIADAWRKSGIAGLLMNALIEHARARGLKEMQGIVLRTNSAMLRFARALGFRLEPDQVDHETIRIVKPLA